MPEMTDRQRVLTILKGGEPDRVPWIPRLNLWYTMHRNNGTLPPDLQGMSLRQAEQSLGMGNPAREGRVFRTQYREMEVRLSREGRDEITEYVTPIGTLTTRKSLSEENEKLGLGRVFTEYPLKSERDYTIFEYVVQHTDYLPTYEEFRAYDQSVGETGLPFIRCGDCPFHSWLIQLAGYDHAYYHLADFPHTVQRLLDLMTERERERLWPVIAQSPGLLFQHGVHFDSFMTPPDIFRKHILPYYRAFSDLLHANRKFLAFHLDADSLLLLDLIRETGMDVADTFTTAPLVRCTLQQARRAWGEKIVIWGGLPSTLLETMVSDAEFERELQNILHTIAPGKAFILGVADNIMPGAQYNRLVRIRDLMEQCGRFPIADGPSRRFSTKSRHTT